MVDHAVWVTVCIGSQPTAWHNGLGLIPQRYPETHHIWYGLVFTLLDSLPCIERSVCTRAHVENHHREPWIIWSLGCFQGGNMVLKPLFFDDERCSLTFWPARFYPCFPPGRMVRMSRFNRFATRRTECFFKYLFGFLTLFWSLSMSSANHMQCPIAISTLRCANPISLLVSASLQTVTSWTITSVSLFVSPLLSTQLVWKYACPVARDHSHYCGYHYEHSH